jgi:phospholipid/cholesterol/gamma-HCH transport system ATP-binding protein
MNDSRAAICVEQISKCFGDRGVLHEVSFTVPRGRACCILGRSGTGKSVTLKLLMGLLKPDSGRIWVEGRDITELNDRQIALVRTRMGFLFQNAALFDSITVGENVAFPLRRHTKRSEKDIQERVHEKLAAVGLEKEIDKMPVDLSGGMKKRAGLARALALEPSILLVDEPSAGLDPITTAEIDSLLMQLKTTAGTTLVVVTHNIPSARRLGDELIVLHQGRVIAQGTAKELDQMNNELVTDFMNSLEGG